MRSGVKESISKRLRRLREKKGVPMREVAGYLGIPLSTYRSWEYGTEIRGEPYGRLAEYYMVSIKYILYGKDEAHKRASLQIEHLHEGLKMLQTEINRLN